MVEYGLLVALIAVVVVVGRHGCSATSIDGLFDDVITRSRSDPSRASGSGAVAATAPAACGFHSKIRPKEVQHDETTA